jgi:hypothetical protein
MAGFAHIFRILFHQFALCARVSENSKLNSILEIACFAVFRHNFIAEDRYQEFKNSTTKNKARFLQTKL